MSSLAGTTLTAKIKFENFQRMWTALYIAFYGVPAPKLGGTFCYCQEKVEVKTPKLDKLGRRTRYTITEYKKCGRRFRQEQTYRRHHRRSHRLTESST